MTRGRQENSPKKQETWKRIPPTCVGAWSIAMWLPGGRAIAIIGKFLPLMGHWWQWIALIDHYWLPSGWVIAIIPIHRLLVKKQKKNIAIHSLFKNTFQVLDFSLNMPSPLHRPDVVCSFTITNLPHYSTLHYSFTTLLCTNAVHHVGSKYSLVLYTTWYMVPMQWPRFSLP